MYIHTRTHGPKQPSQLNSQCFAHPRVYRRMYTKFLRTRRSNDDALYTGNSSVETFHRESPNQVSSPAPSTFCCSLPYAELNGALHLTGRPRRSPSPKPCEATQGRRRQPRRWPAGSPRRYLRQRLRRDAGPWREGGGGGAGAGPPDPNRPPASARAGAFPPAEATAPRGRLLPHGAGSWVSFPKESCNGGERPGEPRPGPAGGIAPLSPPRPAGEGRGAAP